MAENTNTSNRPRPIEKLPEIDPSVIKAAAKATPKSDPGLIMPNQRNKHFVYKSIFEKPGFLVGSNSIVSKNLYNRIHLADKEISEEFNTYMNFGIFPSFADTNAPEYDPDKNYERTELSSRNGTPGVRSLFNRAGAVLIGHTGKDKIDYSKIDITEAHQWRLGLNVPLMDSPYNRAIIESETGCSIKELVTASQKGLMGKETYAYSDFMFCKHLGKVSNNHMITLRRFPIPVDDYIGTTGIDEEMRSDVFFNSKNPVSIGCMVTWLGVSGNDMSNVLKYNYSMPFKELEAQWEDKKLDADKNQGLLNGMFSVFDKQYREEYMNGYSATAANSVFQKFGFPVGNAPYTGDSNPANFKDRTKVYGPVDAVKSTYVRSEQGLKFEQQITLVFEYELRSYNGVNGRQAMLDLISNILNVTYSTGSFWGGGIRGFGASQSNVFNNLNIFKVKGGFTEFIDAFSKDIANFSKDDASYKDTYKEDKNGKTILKEALQVLNQLGGMLMAGMLNSLGRPQKVMYNSLLSPAPVGFWHLTVGNPRKPIMSIGNMIITNCTIEHQGPLGLDDFPTGLKVTVNLNRGKPRDIRDIEKLYMAGNDRIYAPMDTKVFDMYKNAIEYKKHKVANTLSMYNPKDHIHIMEYEQKEIGNETVNVAFKNDEVKLGIEVENNGKTEIIKIKEGEDLDELNASLMKYFGTNDIRAIYVAATEQEWGSNIKSDKRILSEEEYQKELNEYNAKILAAQKAAREKKIDAAKIEYLNLKTEYNNASMAFSDLKSKNAHALYGMPVTPSNVIEKLNAAAEKEIEAYDTLINFMNENKEYLMVPVSDDRKKEVVLSNWHTYTMGSADLSRGYDIMYNHFNESVSDAKEYQNKAPELLQKALAAEQANAKYMDDLLNGRLPSQNNIPVIRQGR